MPYLERDDSSTGGSDLKYWLFIGLTVFVLSGATACGDPTPGNNTCEAGKTCACAGEGTCTEICDGADCQFVCSDSVTCNFECPGGNCQANCLGSGTCNLECSGGGCTMSCQGSGVCNLNSCDDSCELQCLSDEATCNDNR